MRHLTLRCHHHDWEKLECEALGEEVMLRMYSEGSFQMSVHVGITQLEGLIKWATEAKEYIEKGGN